MPSQIDKTVSFSKDSIFLTAAQAVESICFDFRQYGVQILLFAELIRLISGNDAIVKKDTQKIGIWIGMAGHQNMRWMDGNGLIKYMCDAIIGADLSPAQLAAVCSRVFQTRAVPDKNPETGLEGIRIDTGMDTFVCRQCGQCCRVLEYHQEATAEDVARWRELGRNDILKWVGIFKKDGRISGYRIWVIPGTRRIADQCPFLEKIASENRWICRIHDVKPTICRNYPVSRKHAVMTGCPGIQSRKC